jgi:hypothetical protein
MPAFFNSEMSGRQNKGAIGSLTQMHIQPPEILSSGGF